MRELSKARALEIKKQVEQIIIEFGGLQGEITAYFRDSNKIWVRDLNNDNRIICHFPTRMYDQIWRLLESPQSIVNIEGWVTRTNGIIDRLEIEEIKPAAIYQEGDLDKFFGCDLDFTGTLSTSDYLEQLRDEDSDEYTS